MLVNKVLEGLDFTFGYLDDILIFSKNMEEHLQHVRILFERLRQADLKLTKRKCNFLKAHVQYLGHYARLYAQVNAYNQLQVRPDNGKHR